MDVLKSVIAYILALHYFKVTTCAKVQFQQKKSNVTVLAGDMTVVLSCEFSPPPQGVLRIWNHEGIPIFMNEDNLIDDDRVSLQQNTEREYSLKIDNVNSNDEGPYTCMIYSEPVGSMTVYLTVNVPARLTNHISEREITVSEGDDVWLRCSATGKPKPTVSWRHLVPSGDGVMGTGPTYRILDIRREDAGIYECSADNRLNSPDVHQMKIYVKYPPMIEKEQEASEVVKTIHGDVVLDCIGYGYPSPQISWKHNENEYKQDDPSNERVQVVNIPHGLYTVTSMLEVKDIREEDIGKYECIAENEKGRKNRTVYLKNKQTTRARPPPSEIFRWNFREQNSGENSSSKIFSKLLIVVSPTILLQFLVPV